MENPLARLRTGWWFFSLPGYRDHLNLTTYSLFPYEDLPKVIVPTDASWGWLEAQAPKDKWSLSANSYPDGTRTDLSHLPSLLARIPFSVPAEFVSFLGRPSLHSRIRSCTACMLELSEFPVFTAKPPDGVILQFLVDQQGVLRWYLFADAVGHQAVLVSGEIYGVTYSPGQTAQTPIDLFREDFWLCAMSFREFVYRFWLENEVWFTLRDGTQPIPTEQHDYLTHYR